MKMSIWQQFASNHSNSFTVVGTFQTVADAEQAASELRDILRTIGEWYEEPENGGAWEIRDDWRSRRNHNELLPGEPVPLTPPEVAFSQKYNVEWNEPLDWVFGSGASAAVQIFDNLVFVSDTSNTWVGPHPFDSLMEKLGAQEVAANSEVRGDWLYADLTCNAPDLQTAQALSEKLNNLTVDEKRWWYYQDQEVVGFEEVLCSGQTLTFKGLDFLWIDGQLSLLITYLKSIGFTDFNYRIWAD